MPSANTNSASWKPTLEAYEPSLVAASNLVERVARYADSQHQGMAINPFWLTLSGDCGCGKTMLARQLFEAMHQFNPGNGSLWVAGSGFRAERNRRPECVFLKYAEFATRCREDFGYAEYLRSDFLVVIDDLGATRDPSNFVADQLYRLCEVRLGKWTVFTTNLTLMEVGQIDKRIASRMIRDGNQFLKITAGDFAMRKKQ